MQRQQKRGDRDKVSFWCKGVGGSPAIPPRGPTNAHTNTQNLMPYPSPYLVDVPFLTSHIMHLKASAVFL